ncbi:MAG: class I SAM-dependent methyltransferase [Solirubrobacterales bacterium]|nr:class I SAM-dependent methyltransferase [Solirubrobacterales bacterium]
MSAAPSNVDLDVLWHDLECGGYDHDLPLWRELAAEAGGGPVLDVGAGTGRVTLDLAARGIEVVALDADAPLLRALDERAAGLPVQTVAADARDFHLGRRFPLVLVPMQTIQMLGGDAPRRAFLRCAREHVAPGGLLAAALADALESFDAEYDGLPVPDECTIDGVRYASRPLAVVDEGDRAAIHRLREVTGPEGVRTAADDVVRLDRVTAGEVAAEAAALGFTPLPHRGVPQTDEYVGSTVVVLRG